MSNLKSELEEQLAVIDALAARIHTNAINKGFYETYDIDAVSGDGRRETLSKLALVNDNLVGMKLALIHSEVTEILEAIRKSQGTDAIADEFSDVLIRLLDLYHCLRSTMAYGPLKPLSQAIAAKVEVNEGRPHKHGRRF